ncbi:MAG: hypothetical protein ACE5I1_31985, partial [bacterium]
MLKSKVNASLQKSVNVASAGTLGINGSPATEFAITTARELGAEISQHRSQGITQELAKGSDIIFAMAPEHQEFLRTRFPEVRENTFLL